MSSSVTLTVHKVSAETPLGLEFTVIPGSTELIVSKVAKTSPFFNNKNDEDEDEQENITTKHNPIDDESLFPTKVVVPGMQLFGMGGIFFQDKSRITPIQVLELWKSFPVGKVAVSFAGLPISITKPKKETTLGLTLQTSKLLQCIRISKLNPNGLVGNNTMLHVGQKVTALHLQHHRHHRESHNKSKENEETLTRTNNNATTTTTNSKSRSFICPIDAYQVTRQIQAAGPDVTIHICAVDIQGLTTTSITKPTQDTKIGIVLRRHQPVKERNNDTSTITTIGSVVKQEEDKESILDDYIYVAKVTPGGLLDRSLSSTQQNSIVHHKVLSINGMSCPPTVADANGMIKEATSQVVLETIPFQWGNISSTITNQTDLPVVPSLEPGQVLAKITKSNITDKIGLTLQRVYDDERQVSRLVVRHMDKSLKFSLLAQQSQMTTTTTTSYTNSHAPVLSLGMHLISINSIPCTEHMTTQQAMDVFLHAPSIIYIVASPIIAQPTAKSPTDNTNTDNTDDDDPLKLGLSVGKAKVGIIVSKVDPDGPLADSDLQIGQQIIRINGKPCPTQTQDTIHLLRSEYEKTFTTKTNGGSAGGNAGGSSTSNTTLTIEALDVVPDMIPTWPTDCLVIVSAYKPTVDAIVGLGLAKSRQGRIVISRVDESGLLARNKLQPGLVLLKINGVDCPSSQSTAVQLIQQCKGTLELVTAKSMESTPKLVPTSRQRPLGIQLVSTRSGALVISNVDSTNGLFSWNILQKGQRVTRINGLPCPDQPEPAMAMLQCAPLGSTVSIEAVDTLYSVEWPAECLTTVSVLKQYPGQYVGLRLAQSRTRSSRVVISHVDPQGLVGQKSLNDDVNGSPSSYLIPGMVVVSIGGQDCPRTWDAAMDFLNVFPHGRPLTIAAAKSVTYLYRGVLEDSTNGNPSDQWGITVANMPRHDYRMVQKVDPYGLASFWPRSLLHPKQRILEINDTACPADVKSTVSLLRSSPDDKLKITTVDTFSQPWIKDEELVVKVHKPFVSTRVGLGFMKSSQDRVAVSLVEEEGLFGSSGVQVGYIVVSINGQNRPVTTKETISTIVQTEGDLTIVFARTIATVEKPKPDVSLGIKLGRMRKQGVVVHSIEPYSPFSTTSLMERQKIVSINGQSCPQVLVQAVEKLQASEKEVTLEAIDAVYPVWSPECLMTAKAEKTTPRSFVGLDFALSKQGRLAIARVYDKGLFAGSKLSEGHVVVSINGKSIDTTLEAVHLVQDCQGELVLVVAEAVDQVFKRSKDENIGITFGLDPDDGIVVERMDANALVGSTRIMTGQKVKKINGMPCPDNLPEVMALCHEAKGPLEIVARDVMDEPTWPTEGLVTALVQKKTPDSKVGIGFARSTQGRVVIATLNKKGPLGHSGLHIGQIVVSINGALSPESPYEASKAVQECEGEVSIIATSIVATATKSRSDKKVGLSIGRTAKGLTINGVDGDGLFASSMLQKGQLIRSIDGRPCPGRLADAVTLLKESTGRLKLVVVDSLKYKFDWPAECLMSKTISKEYPGQYVGIEVKESLQGRMVVERVDPKGIFAGQDLLPGFVFVTINGEECPDTSDDVIKLLKENDVVSLVLARPVVRVQKPTRDTKVGLTVGRTDKQGVIIQEIDHDGLFHLSPLMKHQKILSINGIPCPSAIEEVKTMVEETEGGLTLEAVDAVYPDYEPEALYTAVAKKTRQRRFCGLEIIRSIQGRICIGRVNPAGIFADSGLLMGHVIVSINGIACPDFVRKSVNLLKSQSEGDIAIVVATTMAEIDKDASSDYLGLSLNKNKTQGIVVHAIDQGSAFAQTALYEKQHITSINHKPCPSEIKAAIVMLGEARGKVKITAVDGVQSEWPIECIVTSTVQKKSYDDFFGIEVERISIGSGQSRLVISRIDSLGLFAQCSDLVVGQLLISINGTEFPSTVEEFLFDLKSVSVGELALVTAKTVAMVDKSNTQAQLGLSLGVDDNSDVIVTKVARDGMFGPTLLRAGQKVIRINGSPCPTSVSESVSLIHHFTGPLIIEAIDRLPPRPGHVTVSVRKPTPSSKVGITMRESIQGRLVISNISSGGLLDRNEGADKLCRGLEILSINNVPCPDTPKEAVELITKAKNVVTIRACSTVVKVQKSKLGNKKKKDQNLGLSLGKNSNGVVVYKIKGDGLFAKTALMVGQKLLSINGKRCPDEVADAIQILMEAMDALQLEAVDVLYHWSPEDKPKTARREDIEPTVPDSQ